MTITIDPSTDPDGFDRPTDEENSAGNESQAQPTLAVKSKKKLLGRWIYGILLAYILLAAIFFRVAGLFWGEYQYLHPDERFLVWVGSDIGPVKNLGEYFDTVNSSLNPHNRGHGFFVYGTFPMFITRYVVEGVFGNSGFKEMTQVGRSLSALADVITVFLVFMVARQLYDKRIALLAAAFSAATVLQIQQSHFFTMDTFITMFSFLAFYFAVKIAMMGSGSKKDNGLSSEKLKDAPGLDSPSARDTALEYPVTPFEKRILQLKAFWYRFYRDPLFVTSLGFGVALGMAVASKLNAAPMAFVLPLAMLIYVMCLPVKERTQKVLPVLCYLTLAAIVSLLVFRILQPYAFSGPGFLGIKINPQWWENIREQRAQSGRYLYRSACI